MREWYGLILFLPFLIVCSGCKKERITTATLPKERIAVATLQHDSGLHWTIPSTWKKQDATGFRIASYQVADTGDFSIVSFPGDAGGLLSNVNRWRGQLGLASISASALSSAVSTIDHPLAPLSYVFLNHQGKAMLVAILVDHDRSVFFKLTGPTALIQEQRPVFDTFLKSIAHD